MDNIEITSEEIKVEKILSVLKNPSCGATSLFVGTTRNHCDGKEVVQLEYETYEKMAVKEMLKVCETMKSKWPLENVAIVHRIGIVPVCESSILIAASSAHRKEAQEAVMYGIDAVKSNVPIWKKEIYVDGSSNWKANNECKWTAS